MNFSKASLLHKFALLCAWGMLAFTTYSTLAPIQNRPSLPASTGAEHIVAFFILGIAFYVAYPQRLRFACSIVLGSAVLLEVFQLLTPDRHGRFQDAVEKMAGGLVGLLIGLALLKAASRWSQFRSVEVAKVPSKNSKV
jgi:VanZ family protein